MSELDQCRLCTGNTVKNSVNIFTKPELLTKINEFFPLKIEKNDELPSKICHKCFDKVNVVCSFFEQSMKSKRYFKRLRDNPESENTRNIPVNSEETVPDLQPIQRKRAKTDVKVRSRSQEYKKRVNGIVEKFIEPIERTETYNSGIKNGNSMKGRSSMNKRTVKNNDKIVFDIGSVVFGKIRGFRHWPAKVLQVDETLGPDKLKYTVAFYGETTIGVLTSENIFPFVENVEEFSKNAPKNFITAMKKLQSEEKIYIDKQINSNLNDEVKKIASRTPNSKSGRKPNITPISHTRSGREVKRNKLLDEFDIDTLLPFIDNQSDVKKTGVNFISESKSDRGQTKRNVSQVKENRKTLTKDSNSVLSKDSPVKLNGLKGRSSLKLKGVSEFMNDIKNKPNQKVEESSPRRSGRPVKRKSHIDMS